MRKIPATARLIGLLGAALSLAELASPGTTARAEVLDPSIPRTIVVGEPRGFATAERVDPQRTGRSPSRLPFPPVERWRRNLGGSIEVPPVVDESGRILVALSVPEVVALSPEGKEIWRARIGSAAAIAPPVLTSDGTLVVVTAAGVAVGVSREGRVRFATPLGMRGRDLDAGPLARSDGGVVLGGRAFVELDADGAVRSRAPLPERAVGALLEGPEGTLATGESGAVYAFRPPGAPRKIASFGGPLRRGAALSGGRTLFAVVGGRSVVGLDLPTGLTHVRLGDTGLGIYDDPITVHPKGLAVAATSAGLLLGADASGNEKIRIALEKGADAGAAAPAASASFFGTGAERPSPPLLIDREGRIAFARQSGRVGVAMPDGSVALAGERMCNGPVALQPAGEDKLVLVCREGTIWMLGK
ncbi:PQQ-binding-like beta-propeller repeat protein [Polyangium aurulentum]|uniref:outer membrane protein assembly factor BamB family protein n=1 Tax=Polyangium aurulentum TaxID=2567896 RepID=UPI0010ADD16A|nr:PQQ-binding-like beta-propeller repeat protein [Polyangium aurulentum]UQA58822.1 PQQ-binding-like beta-propeller repeat protein [Polyangium aurulentum]